MNYTFISGSNKYEINLVKNESVFNFSCFNFIKNLFENKCCSNSFNDKGSVDVINNLINDDNNEQNKIIEEYKTGNSKCKYFEQFEDCDSYNDFIMDVENEKIF